MTDAKSSDGNIAHMTFRLRARWNKKGVAKASIDNANPNLYIVPRITILTLQLFASTWVHQFFVRVARLFSFPCCVFCFVCLRPVSRVHNVVSGLSILRFSLAFIQIISSIRSNEVFTIIRIQMPPTMLTSTWPYNLTLPWQLKLIGEIWCCSSHAYKPVKPC